MSTRGEGVKLQGGSGPKCLEAVGILTSVNVVASKVVIVIMPCPDAAESVCSDGDHYPFKAVLFHDAQARTVQCLSEAQAGKVHSSGMRIARMTSTPQSLRTSVSCPPPETLQAEVNVRLAALTAWAAGEGAAILASATVASVTVALRDPQSSSKPAIAVVTELS